MPSWKPKRSLAECYSLMATPRSPLETETALVGGCMQKVFKNIEPASLFSLSGMRLALLTIHRIFAFSFFSMPPDSPAASTLFSRTSATRTAKPSMPRLTWPTRSRKNITYGKEIAVCRPTRPSLALWH